MAILTMVTRLGDKKEKDNSKFVYTCIADDYSVVRLSGEEVIQGIKEKKLQFTNLGLSEKGLVSTNGAMDKYTLMDMCTGTIVKSYPVIINRVEADDKLVGYTIFNTEGMLQNIDVQQAVIIHSITPFSNGKLRDFKGKSIISSISGHYPLRKIDYHKNEKGSIKADLVFIGSAVGKNGESVKYGGVLVTFDKASDVSKLHSKVVNTNKELISKLYGMSSDQKLRDTLGIKRVGQIGFYGVYPIDVVKKIIKEASNTVTNKIGIVAISTTDYTDGNDESVVAISKDLKVLKSTKGTAKSDAFLKEYTKEIIGFLKEVKFID